MEKNNVELVSGTYFNVLGVNAVLGRTLTDADDQKPGGHPLAVASYSWSQRRLETMPMPLVGRVTIRSTVYTVIGGAPPKFFGATVGQSPNFWIPLAMEKEIWPGNGLDKKLFQSQYIGRGEGLTLLRSRPELIPICSSSKLFASTRDHS